MLTDLCANRCLNIRGEQCRTWAAPESRHSLCAHAMQLAFTACTYRGMEPQPVPGSPIGMQCVWDAASSAWRAPGEQSPRHLLCGTPAGSGWVVQPWHVLIGMPAAMLLTRVDFNGLAKQVKQMSQVLDDLLPRYAHKSPLPILREFKRRTWCAGMCWMCYWSQKRRRHCQIPPLRTNLSTLIVCCLPSQSRGARRMPLLVGCKQLA
jgi:hypothetical protein